MVKIRPAQKNDDVLIDGHRYRYTFKGTVAELDGVPVGIVGVLHTIPLTAFSNISGELKGKIKFIRKYIEQYRELLDSYGVPIYATCSIDIPGASRFLKHVGFQHFNDDTYIWIPRHS